MANAFPLVCLILFAGRDVDGLCLGTPCHCPDTSVIDCSNRGLTEIPEFNLLPPTVLKRLDFSGNDFVTFDPSKFGFYFIGVSRIELLDLSNNRLTSITTSFAVTNSAPLYVALNLSSNNFITFPFKAIPAEFTRVKLVIDISNNQLTSLPINLVADNAANTIPTLTFIARDNLIETIHPMAFSDAGINELYLDVRGNKLTNISEEFYFPISEDRGFNMSGNPWRCDCNLRWILKSDFEDISLLAPPVCNEPPPLNGEPLFGLQADEFVCLPTANEGPNDLAISAGDNVVSCPVTADPESTLGITWMFDLSCSDGDAPLRIVAESKLATLKDVTCFPQANVSCTGSNYAGMVDVHLNVVNADDVGPCPGDHSGAGRGAFIILIILVVLSILACLALGVYYLYLLREANRQTYKAPRHTHAPSRPMHSPPPTPGRHGNYR